MIFPISESCVSSRAMGEVDIGEPVFDDDGKLTDYVSLIKGLFLTYMK